MSPVGTSVAHTSVKKICRVPEVTASVVSTSFIHIVKEDQKQSMNLQTNCCNILLTIIVINLDKDRVVKSPGSWRDTCIVEGRFSELCGRECARLFIAKVKPKQTTATEKPK